MPLDPAETLICQVLRGEPAPWPRPAPADFAEHIRERSLYHGVQTLLHERLTEADDWPDTLRLAFRDFALGRTMWELRHQDVVSRALEALGRYDIDAILLKGSAVAYTHYDNAAARTRGDTDLLIASDRQDEVTRALAEVGFQCDDPIANEAVSIHSRHSWGAPDGPTHVVEVHSRLSLSQMVSRNLSFDELWASAVTVPELGAGARAHDAVDALLVTCYHRTTHKHIPYYVAGKEYFGGNRLIWLYDIHLLAVAYDTQDWEDVVERATRRGLATVTLEGLAMAETCFKTTVPEFVRAALRAASFGESDAPHTTSSPIAQQWLDIRAIQGAGAKLAYLKNALFPPARYMHSKYPAARVKWLPWLYLRRAGDAARKTIAKRRPQNVS